MTGLRLSPLRAAALAAAPAFVLAAYVVLSYPPNHDISWYMYAAGRWLDGARLYRDVVEVNPPLIIWLSALPQAVARVTGAWPATVFRVFVLAIAAVSFAVSLRLLRRPLAEHGAGAACIVAALLACFFVATPRYEFGQREHLAVLLTLPYLLLSAHRVSGGWSPATKRATAAAVAIGVLAGIGFALKPFFLAAWLLPELYVFARLGTRAARRAELLAVAATFAGYILATALFAPDYFRIAQLGAGAYATFLSANVFARGARIMLLALVAVAVWLFARRGSPLQAYGDTIGLGVIGFLIGVLAQRKGWFYHWLPPFMLTTLLLGFGAVRVHAVLRARCGPRWRTVWEGTVAVLAAVFAVAMVLRTVPSVRWTQEAIRAKQYRLPEMMNVVAAHGGSGPIAALSTNLHVGFPLVDYTDMTWGLRFNSLWLLPGAYPPNPLGQPFSYHAPSDMPAAERYQFDAVLEDLLRYRPTVLIVDQMPPGYVLHGFNYLEYFAQDPRFLALLTEYREFPPVERYRILVRARQGPAAEAQPLH